jgi:hypothetical protein
MGRRGRRLKWLTDNLKEKRGCCKLKDEALQSTLWRTHFGTGSSGNAVKHKCTSLSGCAQYGMDSSNARKGNFFRNIRGFSQSTRILLRCEVKDFFSFRT